MTPVLNPVAALILDMDGVIVDTEPLHVDSFRVFLKKRGIVAPEEFLLALIGHSVEENVREIYRTFFANKVPEIEKDVGEREELYLDILKQSDIQPKPGLENLISFCTETHISIALASSSIREQISTILDKLSLKSRNGIDYCGTFSVIVSGEDVVRKKPAPDIYLMAVQKLGMQKAQCLAVEDSPAGIRAAQAAGLKCAAIRTDYVAQERLEIADAIIESLREVPALIQRFGIKNRGE